MTTEALGIFYKNNLTTCEYYSEIPVIRTFEVICFGPVTIEMKSGARFLLFSIYIMLSWCNTQLTD